VGGLWSIAFRSLWARRARSILTIAGIALGVGVLFAALATNDGINRSVDRSVRDIVGRSDLRVAAFTERGLSDDTLQVIRDTTGVAVAAPEIERRTFLAPSPGQGPTLRAPVTVLGVEPDIDARLHDLPGIELLAASSGTTPAGQPGGLISSTLASQDALAVGDSITIQGGGEPGQVDVRVGGILPAGGPLLDPLGRSMVVDIDVARQAFGADVGVSHVDIGLAPGFTADGVASTLESRLTTEPYVLSKPADLAATLRASTADFQATTSLLAAIALFVGAFLIVNTLSMTVAERIREVGLLRAAGATRRQVGSIVVAQALGLGAIGSLLGIVVGLILAALMVGYVQRIAV